MTTKDQHPDDTAGTTPPDGPDTSPDTSPETATEKDGLLARFGVAPDSLVSAQPRRPYQQMLVPIRALRRQRILVNDKQKITEILQTREAEFGRPKQLGKDLSVHFERTVQEAGPNQYSRARPLIEIAIATDRMKLYLPRIVAAGAATVATMTPGAPADIAAAMDRFARDVSLRMMLSLTLDDPQGAALAALMPGVEARMSHEGAAAEFARGGITPDRGSDGAEFAAALDVILAGRVAQIAAFSAPRDLATDLLTVQHPQTMERLDAAFVRHQIGGLLIHSAATVASALGWALHLLATHAEIQDKAAAEAARVWPMRAPVGRPDAAPDATPDPGPDFGAMARLALIRDVLRETMRLYPPVPVILRRPRQVELMADIALRESAQIFISPWHLGRHEAYWRDPEAFDPGRWSENRPETAPGPQYMPFSAGPRKCPAEGIVRLECTVFLAQLLRHFRFAPVPGQTPRPQPGVALRARDGIMLDIAGRHDV